MLRLMPALALVCTTGLGLVACKKSEPPAPPAPAQVVAPAEAPAAKTTAPGPSRVEVTVTDNGFEPSRIPAKAGVPLTLAITRKAERTCATEILFQGQEGKTELPLHKTVEVVYTPKAAGEVKFGCAMGMMIGGVVAVAD